MTDIAIRSGLRMRGSRELEEKVATLEAERNTSPRQYPSGKFPELRDRVSNGLRLRSDDKLAARRRAWLTWTGALFPLAGCVFSFMHLPILATCMSVVFLAVILLNLRNQSRLRTDRVLLADAEKELADKHRIVELESKLAATEARVRIAAHDDAPLSEDDAQAETAEEPRALRQ